MSSIPRRARELPGGIPALAFLASRLIVLVAGLGGALMASRVEGWQSFDPGLASSRLGSLGNTLAAPAFRWDSIHYLDIARHGYAGAEQAAFFPLYPMLMKLLGWVVRSDVAAGALISAASFAIALTLLHRLCELELDRRAADAATLLLALAPLSLFFTAVYTESLFLALSVGAFRAAREDRLRLAGVLAALATVTRVEGILLVVPIALFSLRTARPARRRVDPRLGWLVLSPLALAGFLAYLHSRGYGWLAPLHAQTGQTHAHSLVGPVLTVASAIGAAFSGLRHTLEGQAPLSPSLGGPFSTGFQNVLLVIVLALSLAALLACRRRLPAPYTAYAALALLLTTSSRVELEPLKSLDRYVLTIFPLWMGAGAWLAERRSTRIALALAGVLLIFYTVQFTTWAFIA